MAIDRIPGVGPQNSDIAAAVAAPSAATIATQVAASVPTLAQITSTVQANAGSPFGGTWTNLGSYSFPTNATQLSITGLNGYKYLRFLCTEILENGGNHNFNLRFNNDSSGVYTYRMNGLVGTNADYAKEVNASSFTLMYISAGFPASFDLSIQNASSSSTAKLVEWTGDTNFFSNRYRVTGFGNYSSSSSISSAQIFCSGSNFGSAGNITVLGAN
jgi:hypothetical protein